MSGARYAGQVALVTGASRGIGREIAVGLGRGGALVGVHYSGSADAADATLQAVRAAGGNGALIRADLASRDGPSVLAETFLDTVQKEKGSRIFDILVNNAGVGTRTRISEVDAELFDRVMTINFRAPFFLIRALAPSLNDGGRIINVSSMATRSAFPEMSVYAPSKAALETLTVLLAKEYGERGITVNAVLPGATATEMNPVSYDPERAAATARTVALGRVGQAADIASVVLFLASREGGWITGQRIDASGGQRL